MILYISSNGVKYDSAIKQINDDLADLRLHWLTCNFVAVGMLRLSYQY